MVVPVPLILYVVFVSPLLLQPLFCRGGILICRDLIHPYSAVLPCRPAER